MYYTCKSGRHKDFTAINPSGDWDILIGESLNEETISALNIYFNDSSNITQSGKNKVSYLSDNLGKDYVEIDRDDSKYGFKVDDKVIDSYYQEAENFYYNVFDSILKGFDYNILSVKTSFISSQHYNSEGNKDSKVYLNEIIFNFELGYNEHYFFKNNYVQIGVNALTGDITSVRSKLLSIEKTTEVILDSSVNQYIDSLPKDDNLSYIKSYLLDKDSGELRPAVISINLTTTEFKVLKHY